MTTWLVELAEGPSRTFLDVQTLSGEYYKLSPRFIGKLQRLIREQADYKARYGVILSIKEPSETQLTTPFILFLITRVNFTASFLGGLDELGGGTIVGVWPEQMRDVLSSDSKAILSLLYIITERPEVVKSLHFLF
jgi:hypothetical protein